MTFTLTISNAGPAPALDVVLSDPFPAGVRPVSVDNPDCVITGVQLACDLGTLDVGATVVVQVEAIVDTVGSYTNVVEATSSTPLVDPRPLRAEASVSAVAPPVPPVPPAGGGGAVAGTGTDPSGWLGLAAALMAAGGMLATFAVSRGRAPGRATRRA